MLPCSPELQLICVASTDFFQNASCEVPHPSANVPGGLVRSLIIARQSNTGALDRKKTSDGVRYLEAPLCVLCTTTFLSNPRKEAAEEWRRSLTAQALAGALGEGCQVFSDGQGCGRD